MADLKPAEVEKAKLHFDIYDFEGIGKVDAFHLGDLLRSLDLVPTQAAVLKAGGSAKLGEKKLALEEFLPIYSQLKKERDVGSYEDFAECMKVYDKMDNGCMMEAELAHIFMSLGEKLTDQECDDIMKECTQGQTPDEDGNIKYDLFLKKLMAGPFPEEAKEK
uniref:Myosin light chain alkali n=1 Tax=Aceria tosichella TaxID=561515 RepID=A0A6G1SFN1_9ACAR